MTATIDDVASSLDGFITDPEDQFAWLDAQPQPVEGIDRRLGALAATG